MSSRNIYSTGQVLRGALLGCGQISGYHLRAWRQIDGVNIVALANRTVQKAEARADEFGISRDRVYSDHRALLEQEELDFVDIATAPDIHRRQVEDAAARGVNVLCQKPFAPSLEDAQAMMQACDRARVLFSINENWRWRAWYRQLKGLIDQGEVGRPRYIRIFHHSNQTLPLPDGSPPPMLDHTSYLKTMDKLILFEWGIHLLDVLRYLFGEVHSIYARMERTSPFCVGEDRALLTLAVGGVHCLVDISWASIGIKKRSSLLEQVTLEGDAGSIELLPDEGDIFRASNHAGARTWPAYTGTREEAYQASYAAAQRHFAQCLRAGLDPETVAGDNIHTLKTTFAAYESAAANKVVFLQDG